MDALRRKLIARALEQGKADAAYTLDIDATQIVAEKYDAKVTYKGQRGYMPIVGHLAENGLAIGDEFRQGNEAPAARNLEFIKHCAAQLPSGKRIGALRADSAAYQADIINWCHSEGVSYAIGADLDAGVRVAIRGIGEEQWQEYQDGHVAETVHTMNRTEQAFRLVVVRRPAQMDLLEGGSGWRYAVIASNRQEAALETVKWYCRRGEASENRIKELKVGFGMERMPCGEFEANAMFFRLGTIAYDLFVLFKVTALEGEYRRVQVQTLRWRLYHVAGKVVSHAGALVLKVSQWAYEEFERMRKRMAQMPAAA